MINLKDSHKELQFLTNIISERFDLSKYLNLTNNFDKKIRKSIKKR